MAVRQRTRGFHRPERRRVHEARSAVRCPASRMKGELHPKRSARMCVVSVCFDFCFEFLGFSFAVFAIIMLTVENTNGKPVIRCPAFFLSFLLSFCVFAGAVLRLKLFVPVAVSSVPRLLLEWFPFIGLFRQYFVFRLIRRQYNKGLFFFRALNQFFVFELSKHTRLHLKQYPYTWK